MSDKAKLFVKRSYRDGAIGVGIILSGSGWNDDSVKVNAMTHPLPEAARAFAADLIAAADSVEKRTKAKQEHEARRRAWWARQTERERDV